MPSHLPKKYYDELYGLLSSIKSPKEAKMLFEDLATPQEIEAFAQRWQLIKQLDAGKPQRDIAKDLGISITKITRGSRMLQYGTGGFGIFLKKLSGKKK